MRGWDERKVYVARHCHQDCFWGLGFQDGYLEFPVRDTSAITVLPWEDNISVKPHRHSYYEFALVTKGSCIHSYKGVKAPLVPGDVFLIEPHQEHSYEIQASVHIINCNFIAEGLGDDCNEVISGASRHRSASHMEEDTKRHWDELLRYVSLDEQEISQEVRQSYLNTQGIIHLESKEMEEVERLLWVMIDEQEKNGLNSGYAKAAYLQLILILFQRVQVQKNQRISRYSTQKKAMIYDALAYIEEHLDEKIDFEEISGNSFLSPSYFRAIFKDVTGLTPIEYLNRMRIVKSLEYLEMEQLSITDAAARVGIFDSNYYSRLFKKVMGYSPRYFKSIREKA
ncbi:AraC family transcriptional regulator [Ruminococcus sp. OA3]|uniref:AraC family transcriptional regulator n=1 Tax=Ruminococcus sp. OA3 TaxID=2914164 RepID=UPI001F0648F0|nr:AraC family transcriptional regulator [Ruminococcus sp. OA3]MCH1984511.1 AraC family transcriptional regulator [Ruminococcus sp. OA3]